MTTIIDAPARVDDLQLIGAMVGSGFRTPPSLVRRSDGQTLQLTPLLYRVLEAIDGRRTCAEIATVVSHSMRRSVSEDMVATLVDQHLRPMGLLKLADGSEPPLKRSNPLLALKLKFAVTNPRATRRLTDPFRFLFRPALVSIVVLGFLAITWWVFFDQGLAPAAYDAFQRPHLLLLVFVVTVLSGGFHEFGHAAAARYSGANPGVIGAGIYLVWPAFYTDVTDSYRLGRRGRLRTDLGGLYFNAIVVVLTFAWWYTTQWDALLLLVATQVMQMVHQLMPLLRFDGYHVLADLTGVPDLYHRIKPTLLGLLPHRWFHPENRVLKPWARAVITAWVLVTIPMLAFMLLALVTAVPRLLGTAWAAVQQDAGGVPAAWQHGGLVDASAQVLQVLAVVLPVMAGFLIMGRIGLRWFRGLARWSRGSVLRRIAAATLSAVVLTALFWAWWPQPGTYRPIQPNERGLITAAAPERSARRPGVPGGARDPGCSRVGASAERRLAGGAPLEATFQKGQALPTKAHPRLAMVLVPRKGASTGNANNGQPPAEPWVFPFDKPLPPEEGDNQAAAFNTTDDSVTYDVAFALVWATGDEVLNVNEAHAYASCSNCVTVAVAFQVVLIMDHARVVVPQNLAVAANYECYQCITAAIANQLVLSVEETPGEEQLLALGDVWGRLTQFGQTITSYSLAQISAQLEAFQAEIVAILDNAPPVPPGHADADGIAHRDAPRRQQRTVADRLVARPVIDQPEPATTPTDTTPTDTTPTDTTPTDTTPTDTTPTDTAPTDPAPTDRHRRRTPRPPRRLPSRRPPRRRPHRHRRRSARASAAHPSVKNAATTSAAVVSDRSSAAPWPA